MLLPGLVSSSSLSTPTKYSHTRAQDVTLCLKRMLCPLLGVLHIVCHCLQVHVDNHTVAASMFPTLVVQTNDSSLSD